MENITIGLFMACSKKNGNRQLNKSVKIFANLTALPENRLSEGAVLFYLSYFSLIRWMIAVVTSLVEAVPPISGVKMPSLVTLSITSRRTLPNSSSPK